MTKRAERNELRQQLQENIDRDGIDISQHRPWTYVGFDTGYTAKNNKFVACYLWGVSKICWPDKWDGGKGVEMAIDRALGWAVSDIIPPEKG